MKLIYKNTLFSSFFFFEFLRNFLKVRTCFGMFGVFVKQIVISNIGFGFFVFNSIWEHRLKIFFDRTIEFFDPPKIENFPGSVNNFRIEGFWS